MFCRKSFLTFAKFVPPSIIISRSHDRFLFENRHVNTRCFHFSRQINFVKVGKIIQNTWIFFFYYNKKIYSFFPAYKDNIILFYIYSNNSYRTISYDRVETLRTVIIIFLLFSLVCFNQVTTKKQLRYTNTKTQQLYYVYSYIDERSIGNG